MNYDTVSSSRGIFHLSKGLTAVCLIVVRNTYFKEFLINPLSHFEDKHPDHLLHECIRFRV